MANAMPIMLARIIGAYLLLTAIAVFVIADYHAAHP